MTPVTVVGGDGLGGVEFAIEAHGFEPENVGLVVEVDPVPYLRTYEELEQRRKR